MSPVMARCACPEAYPVAECLEHAPPTVDPYGLCMDEAPPDAIAATIGGVTALGCVLLGATLILLARAAWHAARALAGHQ